jgi:putative DNA primase/helicase
VNWRQEEEPKVPVNPLTLGNGGMHWPSTWTPFPTAQGTALRHHLGLGFVLTDEDPYTCVDLDKCVDRTGQVSEQTRAILDRLAGYVELSPSSTGLHVWVKNNQPLNRRTHGIEIYSSARWITVTGRSNPRAPQEIPERTAAVDELVRVYFPHEAQVFVAPPVALEDDVLWQRLFHAKHGSFFESLFRGDTSVCFNDHSRAVIMLANQLAILTNGDAARVKQLLCQTGLVNEKWEERRGKSTWIDHQITDAIRYIQRRGR